MKLVENKKLFGKINLIDILLVIIIAIVGLIVYNVVFKSETAVNMGATYFTTKCIIKIDDLPVGASEYLKAGADVYDNETNVYIGKIVEFSSGDTMAIKVNHETNEFIESKTPSKETVYMTVEVNVSDQGSDLITANNYYVKVGKYLSVRSNNFAGGGYMTFIDREAK